MSSGNPNDSEPALRDPYIGTFNETTSVLTPMVSLKSDPTLETTVYGKAFKTDLTTHTNTSTTEVLNRQQCDARYIRTG
jgi:hypothetical protein